MTYANRSKSSIGLLILLVMTMSVLLVSAFVYPPAVPLGWFGRPGLDLGFGLLSLVGIAVMLPLIRNQYRTIRGYMLTLPCLFGMMALVNPQVLYFTPYHLAAGALCAASLFYLRYWIRENRSSDLFLTALCLSVAALAVPYMIWLVFPLLVMHARKMAYVIAAMVVPWLYHFGYHFLCLDTPCSMWASEFFTRYVLVKEQWFSVSLLQLIVLAVFGLIFARAVLHLFRKERLLLRPMQWMALLSILYAMVCLCGLAMIFESSFHNPWQLPLLIPTSLIVFDFLHDRFSDYEGWILVILLIGALLILRAAQIL